MAYDIRFDVKQTGADTIDQISSKMAVMQKQVANVATEMKHTAQAVIDAQTAMDTAIASGNAAGAASLAAVVAEKRASLETLVAKHRELKASVDEVTSSFTRQMPAVQALNAEFSMMEGRLPTRALGSLASSIGGLGPLMQGLFPIFAAGMFVDLLGQMIGKVGELYNKWDPVVKAETLALEQMKKLNAEYDKLSNEDRRLRLDKIERDSGKAERYRAESKFAGADLASDSDAVDILLGKIAKQNAIIKAGTSNRGNWDSKGKPIDDLSETALAAVRTRDDALGPQLEVARLRVKTDTDRQADLDSKVTVAQNEEDKKADAAAKAAARPGIEAAKRNRAFTEESVVRAADTLAKSEDDPYAAVHTEVQERLNKAAASGITVSPEAMAAATRETIARNTEISKNLIKRAQTEGAKFPEELKKLVKEGAGKAVINPEGTIVDGVDLSGDLGVSRDNDATAKQTETDFLYGQRKKTSGGEKDVSAARAIEKSDAESDEYTVTKSLQETIRGNSLATRSGGMSGSQAAGSDYAARVDASNQILEIEKNRIGIIADADLRDKEMEVAKKQNAESLYEAQIQYEEALDELREKNLEKYQKDATSIFDALTDRQVGAGRALGMLLKKDALSEGGTLFGNVMGPVLQSAGQGVAGGVPGSWGKTLKGTMLDPSNKAIPDAAQTSIVANTSDTVSWLKQIYKAVSGDTSASDPTSADPASAISMAASNPLTNPLAAMSAMATSSLPAALSTGPLATIQKALGLAGGGIGSALSGNGLSTLLGYGTPGVNGQPGTAPTTGQQIGAGVGLAATLGAGTLGILAGIHAGGAGGALTAAGSGIGMAAAVTTNVVKALGTVMTPLLSAIPIVGSIAAIALPLIGSLFGNGPVQRANQINQELSANQYIAPQALNVTQSSNGNFTDFNARGQIRTSDFSAVPTVRQGSVWEQTHGLFGPPPTYYDVPGTQTGQFNPATAAKPTTVINVNAMDVASFADFADRNHIAIGNAAAKNLQNVHGSLATEVHRTANG
jgi:curved DNA-binding protein CbpA